MKKRLDYITLQYEYPDRGKQICRQRSKHKQQHICRQQQSQHRRHISHRSLQHIQHQCYISQRCQQHIHQRSQQRAIGKD